MDGIEINERNYLSLRKAYRKAVAKNQESFEWKVPGTEKSTENYSLAVYHELVTDYAKHLLEYMEMSPLITDAIKAEDDPKDE